MVRIAQLAERRSVAPDVAGSSPVSHPNYFNKTLLFSRKDLEY